MSTKFQSKDHTKLFGIILYQVMEVPRYANAFLVNIRRNVDAAQADSVFSGISTFGRLPYFPCLASDDVKYDIAFIGMLQCSLSLFQTIKGFRLTQLCRCSV